MKRTVHTATQAFLTMFSEDGLAKDWQAQTNTEQDEQAILSQLHFAEKVFIDRGLMLCPLSHYKLKYFSPNCEEILGHRHADLLRKTIADIFALIHPEDLPSVEKCLNFVKSLEPYDPEKYRFVMQYRLKDEHGTYIHVQDEKIALSTLNSKYLYFNMYQRVPEEEKFYKVKLEIHKLTRGKFLQTYTYHPKQEASSVTPRQNDIIKLIIQGLSNQEIADKLNLSLYTVKNHKQAIFRKIKVKNSLELADYVRKHQI